MADQQDDLRGFLMRDEKRTNERAPEFTGKCTIHGKEWRVAAWVKESKAGKKYFSLSFDEPREPEAKPAPKPQNVDSDVPF